MTTRAQQHGYPEDARSDALVELPQPDHHLLSRHRRFLQDVEHRLHEAVDALVLADRLLNARRGREALPQVLGGLEEELRIADVSI